MTPSAEELDRALDAPLVQWIVITGFESPAECHGYQGQEMRKAGTAALQAVRDPNITPYQRVRHKLRIKSLRYARCISATDTRLRGQALRQCRPGFWWDGDLCSNDLRFIGLEDMCPLGMSWNREAKRCE